MKVTILVFICICFILNTNSTIIEIKEQQNKFFSQMAKSLQALSHFNFTLIQQQIQQKTTNAVSSPISFPSIKKQPIIESQQRDGAPQDVKFDLICFARIFQQGLMRLPQLRTMKTIPLFKKIQKQPVSGYLYYITYDEPTYHAQIIGLCQGWLQSITLNSVNFIQKV